MMSYVTAKVQSHLRLLRAVHAAQDHAATVLDHLPLASWPNRIRSEAALRTHGALQHVLDVATRQLYENTDDALLLARAVLDHLPRDTTPLGLTLLGRALKVYAHALRQHGDGDLARATVEEAMRVLATTAAGNIELQYARILAAYVAHEAGDADAALEFLKEAATELARRSHARGLLKARMMEGAILFEQGEYVRAQALFGETLPVAEHLGDAVARAQLLANLGQCAQRLRQDADALTYFSQATPLYAQLGMIGEAQKIVWGMAKIAGRHGQVTQAVAALRSSRDAFLQRGMLLSAAVIGLDLVEMLVMLDRHALIPDLLAECIAVFACSSMPASALAALRDIHAAAAASVLDSGRIGAARAAVTTELHVA